MVFRRTGRPTLYFQAKTATGWKQMSSGTSNRTLANKIDAMWGALAVEHRAWDILNRVLSGALAIGTLYDRWLAAKYSLTALRRHLEDVDVMQFRDEFLAVYARGVKQDSADHVRVHLTTLATTLMRSAVSSDLLTRCLYSVQAKRNTLRKYHSSWSVYFAYLTDVKGLFERNPMESVERPGVEKSPIRFYEIEDVQRIVDWQPTPERRAFFALVYATAADVSTALGLVRSDVWSGTKEIRAAGTKTHTRDRVCRIAEWAWPLIARHVAPLIGTARVFPATWSRWTVSDWHRETVKALGLPAYPLRNARDHWAVRQLRGGAPIAMVQAQLGHGSPMQTLTKYGRFIPSASDRAKWEKEATKSDRRSANSGAKGNTVKLSNSRGGT